MLFRGRECFEYHNSKQLKNKILSSEEGNLDLVFDINRNFEVWRIYFTNTELKQSYLSMQELSEKLNKKISFLLPMEDLVNLEFFYFNRETIFLEEGVVTIDQMN